ncbi:MAG: hypothetical protein VX738_15005 [Planctomycetota bacterium]|nr:hypothetical protein [Planctomycetota bacterium]
MLPFVFITFVYGCYWLVNGDIWWHLKAGELILAERRIPTHNSFTYTNPESIWIDLHWGFQILVAFLYKNYGTAGLIVTKSLMGASTFLLIMKTTTRKLAGWIVVVCLAPFLYIFIARYHVRPEMISLMLLAATIYIIHRSQDDLRALWMLVPVQLLWVNTQGLFILQHLVLGAYLLEQFLTLLRHRTNVRRVRTVALVLLISVIASLVNPYGLRGALFPFELMAKMTGDQREFFQQLAGETSGMAEFIDRYGIFSILENNTTLLLLVTTTFVLGSQILACIVRRQFAVYHCCLIVGFGYLAWQMNRNSNLFAIVYGYVLLTNVVLLVNHFRQSSEPPGNRSSNPDQTITILPLIKGAVLLTLAMTMVSSVHDLYQNNLQNTTELPLRRYGFNEHPWYKHDAAIFLDSLPGPMNIYVNDRGLGMAGVVIYHCYHADSRNTKRVYADARLEANSIQVLKDFQRIPKLLESDALMARPVLVANQENMPILMLGNSLLLSRPVLLDRLINDPYWVCVYLDPPDPQTRKQGLSIFMPSPTQQRMNIDPVSIVPLLEFTR